MTRRFTWRAVPREAAPAAPGTLPRSSWASRPVSSSVLTTGSSVVGFFRRRCSSSSSDCSSCVASLLFLGHGSVSCFGNKRPFASRGRARFRFGFSLISPRCFAPRRDVRRFGLTLRRALISDRCRRALLPPCDRLLPLGLGVQRRLRVRRPSVREGVLLLPLRW